MANRREEGELEDTAVREADQAGWVARKLKFVGRKGAQDHMFYKHGRIVFIEFKKPSGGRLGGLQAKERRLMHEHGLESYVVRELRHFREILGLV